MKQFIFFVIRKWPCSRQGLYNIWQLETPLKKKKKSKNMGCIIRLTPGTELTEYPRYGNFINMFFFSKKTSTDKRKRKKKNYILKGTDHVVLLSP